MSDGQYVSDSAALSFLTKHAFDFNDLVYGGLPPSGLPNPQETAENFVRLANFVESAAITMCSMIGQREFHLDLGHSEKAAFDYLLDLFKDALPNIKFEVKDEERGVLLTLTQIASVTQAEIKTAIAAVKKNEVLRGRLYSVTDLRTITNLLANRRTPVVLHNGFMDLMHVGSPH